MKHYSGKAICWDRASNSVLFKKLDDRLILPIYKVYMGENVRLLVKSELEEEFPIKVTLEKMLPDSWSRLSFQKEGADNMHFTFIFKVDERSINPEKESNYVFSPIPEIKLDQLAEEDAATIESFVSLYNLV
jgi:hypothetical protein